MYVALDLHSSVELLLLIMFIKMTSLMDLHSLKFFSFETCVAQTYKVLEVLQVLSFHYTKYAVALQVCKICCCCCCCCYSVAITLKSNYFNVQHHNSNN